MRERHAPALAKLQNTHTGVREGFVYMVSNPAWPGFFKIGCAVDYEDRLGSFNTGSPHRDYRIEVASYCVDRKRAEAEVHRAFAPFRYGGEWFDAPKPLLIDFVKETCASINTEEGQSN